MTTSIPGGGTGGAASAITGITEADIAQYLLHNPGFFERHAELLAAVQIASPHGGRAVSLQERQMQMLRDRIKGLEQRMMEMIRHGGENLAIADRLHRFTRAVLLTAAPGGLPVVLVNSLKHEFLIPQAALRLWGAAPDFDGQPFTSGVSDDTRTFAASLSLPYCGANTGFEAADWLEDAPTVASLALIPLRAGAGGEPFGMLVLGSPDPTRYTAEMGTEFLMRVGEVAAAALSRLLPSRSAGGLVDPTAG